MTRLRRWAFLAATAFGLACASPLGPAAACAVPLAMCPPGLHHVSDSLCCVAYL